MSGVPVNVAQSLFEKLAESAQVPPTPSASKPDEDFKFERVNLRCKRNGSGKRGKKK